MIIIVALFWTANELITIILKLSKLIILGKKMQEKYIFQTICRTNLTLKSKDAEK